MRLRRAICASAFGLGAIFIAPVVFLAAESISSVRELLPSLRVMIDPDYAPSVTLGNMVFRIPNRDLAYPWRRGSQPASTLCTSSDAFRQKHEDLCTTLAVEGSVSLILPLQIKKDNDHEVKWMSSVLVIFGSKTLLPAGLLQNYPLWRRGQLPTQVDLQKDIGDYAAFKVLLTAQLSNSPLFKNRTHLLMVRRVETEPRFADCDESTFDPTTKHTICVATMGYMTAAYPQRSDGTFPYLIEFSLPMWALPQSTDLAAEVSAQVSSFASVLTSPD